jgi:hypothetical protein
MKLFKFMFLFAISALLFSCSGKPDNKVYGSKVEFSHYEPQGAGKPVKAVSDSFVLIQPTWGQAHIMASQRGDNWIWKVIQLVLIGGLLYIIYLVATDKKEFEIKIILTWVVLGWAFIASNWQSASIKWENNWYVPKAQYEKEMKEHGSTKAIWDSLENNGLIEWGKYSMYKK